MSGRCYVEDCDKLAEVVLKGPDGTELEACGEHHEEMLLASQGLVRTLRRVRRPQCCIANCSAPAFATVTEGDGEVKPVCQEHLESLAWIDLPQDLLSDRPGWSH